MSGWLSRLFDTSAVPQDYTAPANQLGPLARQVMTNPVGTETTSPYASQSVGVPSGPFNPIEAMTPNGPMLGTDVDRAHALVTQGITEYAPTLLGMVGDAPGGKASPFEFRPDPGRRLPADNYLKPLDAHAPMMFREEAPDEVARLLSGQGMPLGRDEKFLADNPDIALGQGGNKGGIQLAFDASKITGQVNRAKPAWDLGYQNGTAEYVGKDTTQNFRSALAGVRVPDALNLPKTTSAQVERGLSGLVSKGWTKRPTDNGYTEYLPPT